MGQPLKITSATLMYPQAKRSDEHKAYSMTPLGQPLGQDIQKNAVDAVGTNPRARHTENEFSAVFHNVKNTQGVHGSPPSRDFQLLAPQQHP